MTHAEEMADLLRWLDADPAGHVQIMRGKQIVYYRNGTHVLWPLRCSTLTDALRKSRALDTAAS